MSKIAICSLFRDNESDVLRTFLERAQWQYDAKKIVHICIEGDSIDGTYEQLRKINGFRTILEKIDQGTVKIGSFAEPSRLKALAQLWNRALDIAVDEKADYTFILDSDITVPSNTISKLVSCGKDVVAPMLFFQNSRFFRDCWGYHKDGNDFVNKPPYHKAYMSCHGKLFEVDGVGCPFIKYEVLRRGARCDDEEVRGLSRAFKTLGYKIWVDPTLGIYHPRNGQEIPPPHEVPNVSTN